MTVVEAPQVFLSYQSEITSDSSPVIFCEKSRRIGISWAIAGDSALLAATAGKAGMDTWYIGYNKDMAEEFINDAASWTRHYQLAAESVEETVIRDEDQDILAFRIRYASGYRVTALSSRPSNLRGKDGRLVIDEAAHVPDLQGLMKAALAWLMWGGQVFVVSSHNGEDSYFNQLVKEIKLGKWTYKLYTYTLDDALAAGLYKRICLVLGREWSPEAEAAWRQELIDLYGEDAEEELFCNPTSGGSVYLPSVLVEQCMNPARPVLRWELKNDFNQLDEITRTRQTKDWCECYLDPVLRYLPQNVKSYYGMDFGRTNDLTVIAPLLEMEKLKRYVPMLVELRNVPVRVQQQILYYLVDRLPNFIAGAMDARGNGQTMAEQAGQKYRNRIHEVMFTQEKYRVIMPRYKGALEDGAIELPAHSDILADHRLVKLEKGVPKVPERARVKGTDGKMRHGDSAIALALAQYAATEHRPNEGVVKQSKPVANSRGECRGFFGENQAGAGSSRGSVRRFF